MNRLYHWLGYFNDALYYSILWFFVGGMCTMQVLTHELSIMHYVLVFVYYFTCLWIQHRFVENQRTMILGISVFLSYLSFHTFAWYVMLAGFVYYALGGFLFYAVCDKKVYLQDEIKIILLVLAYASMACFLMNYSSMYYATSSTGLFFVLFSVVYCIRTNVITEYEHNTTETIQKERNIVAVNLLSLFVTILCFLVRNYIVDFLMLCLVAVVYAGYFFVRTVISILLGMTNFVFWFLNFLPRVQLPQQETEELFAVLDEYMLDYEHEYIPPNTTWLYVLGIFLAVLIGIWLIRKLYVRFVNKDSKDGTSEEKEFIFDSNEWMASFNDKVKELQAYSQLSKIRKKYIHTVNACIKEGNLWKVSFTPNEYLRSIDRKATVQKYDLEDLTKQYNEDRYR